MILTRRAITGILHLLNKTPIDWFSKRQAIVEIATHSSKFVAARIIIEQIITLCVDLYYFSISIHEICICLGTTKVALLPL